MPFFRHTGAAVVILALLYLTNCPSQTAASAKPTLGPESAGPGSTGPRPAVALTPGVRTVNDPGLGMQWSLLPNEIYPAGPASLVAGPLLKTGTKKNPVSRGSQPPVLIIRSGDAVMVEEHDAIADAVLQATALGSAARGETVRVRLQVGGRVVLATALASGLARLALTPEAW